MACSCNKNRNNSRIPKNNVKNIVGSPNSTPNQIKAQNIPSDNSGQVTAQSISSSPNDAGLNTSKRKTQALRREAILKAFGK